MASYVKLYRSIWNNPVVTKDAEYLAVWIWLLTHAEWRAGKCVIFGGNKITLESGQITTGRKEISEKTKVEESKVQRILKRFEIEHQIEQVTDHRCRLITIVNWGIYQVSASASEQESEQVIEQQVNKCRTSSEQVLNTNKEYKNNKNIKNNKNHHIYDDDDDEFLRGMEYMQCLTTDG